MTIIDLYNFSTTTSYVGIAFVTYLVIEAIKKSKIKNRYMPLIALAIGGTLGFFMSRLIYGDNPGYGMIYGVMSGALATGSYETIKNIFGGK